MHRGRCEVGGKTHFHLQRDAIGDRVHGLEHYRLSLVGDGVRGLCAVGTGRQIGRLDRGWQAHRHAAGPDGDAAPVGWHRYPGEQVAIGVNPQPAQHPVLDGKDVHLDAASGLVLPIHVHCILFAVNAKGSRPGSSLGVDPIALTHLHVHHVSDVVEGNLGKAGVELAFETNLIRLGHVQRAVRLDVYVHIVPLVGDAILRLGRCGQAQQEESR